MNFIIFLVSDSEFHYKISVVVNPALIKTEKFLKKFFNENFIIYVGNNFESVADYIIKVISLFSLYLDSNENKKK